MPAHLSNDIWHWVSMIKMIESSDIVFEYLWLLFPGVAIIFERQKKKTIKEQLLPFMNPSSLWHCNYSSREIQRTMRKWPNLPGTNLWSPGGQFKGGEQFPHVILTVKLPSLPGKPTQSTCHGLSLLFVFVCLFSFWHIHWLVTDPQVVVFSDKHMFYPIIDIKN